MAPATQHLTRTSVWLMLLVLFGCNLSPSKPPWHEAIEKGKVVRLKPAPDPFAEPTIPLPFSVTQPKPAMGERSPLPPPPITPPVAPSPEATAELPESAIPEIEPVVPPTTDAFVIPGPPKKGP